MSVQKQMNELMLPPVLQRREWALFNNEQDAATGKVFYLNNEGGGSFWPSTKWIGIVELLSKNLLTYNYKLTKVFEMLTEEFFEQNQFCA